MIDIKKEEDPEKKLSRGICYFWGAMAVLIFLTYFVFSWGEISFSKERQVVVYPNEETTPEEFQQIQDEIAEEVYKGRKEPTPDEIMRGAGDIPK